MVTPISSGCSVYLQIPGPGAGNSGDAGCRQRVPFPPVSGFVPGLLVVSGQTLRPVNGQAVPLTLTGRLLRPALLLRVPRGRTQRQEIEK